MKISEYNEMIIDGNNAIIDVSLPIGDGIFESSNISFGDLMTWIKLKAEEEGLTVEIKDNGILFITKK